MKKKICMILTVLLLLCVLPGQVQALEPECTTVSEATEILRQAMVARESTVEIQCALPKSVFDGSGQQASTLSQEILAQAESHTGVPVEGDYLKLNRRSVSMGCSWTVSGEDILLTLTYDMEYYTTAQQEQQVTQAVGEALDSLDLDRCSDYEKICRIYKYIADHVAYDYEHLNDDSYTRKHSTYAAIIDGTAVCQGYTTLLYRMLLEEGIDCRVITGIGNGGNHAWNIAKLDGAYYLLDVTWDETSTPEYYWYFLKGSDAFGDHTPDSIYTTAEFQAKYPVSAEDYTLPTDGKELTEGDFTYTLSNGFATITKYTGLDEDVVIPARIGGYPVIAVGHEAIEYNDTMKTLTISEGIESIFMGSNTSFVFCSALEEIHLPESLVVNISYDKGAVCGTFGFFYGCDQVKNIHVPQTNPYIEEVEGVIYSKNMSAILCYPPAKTEETYIAPDTVRSIADSAFYHQAYLKEVILPDEITYIGYWAFCGTELEKINIPAQCEVIGQFAFRATNLKSIHIPASLRVLFWTIAEGAPLETISVDPENPYFTAIDNVLYAMNENGVPYCLMRYPSGIKNERFVMPDFVTEIMDESFCDAKLKELVLSNNLIELSYISLFDCMNLQRLVIPTSVKSIDRPWGNNYMLKEIYYLGTEEQWNDIDQTKELPSYTLLHFNVTDPKTHSWVTNVVPPQCEGWIGHEGYSQYRCSCGYEYDMDFVDPIPHDYQVNEIPPTCTAEGMIKYTCSRCGHNDWEHTDEPLGHDYEASETVPPTETDYGYTVYACIRCEDSYFDNYIPPVIPEDTEPIEPEPSQPEDTQPTEPDPIEPEETDPTEPEDTQPTEPSEPDAPEEPVVNAFHDVKSEDYFYNSVLWAVKNQITNGTGEGLFSPEQKCTRNQVVTFLWRAAGEPEPSSSKNPFVDVAESDYFYKAVLWAVEQGITNGMDATHFGSTQECTRAQVATFLWRAQGQPNPDGNGETFQDVQSGAWYENAVLWAVENGVTNGMGDGKFAPDATCTRGQIVTFLYRALK